MLNNLFSFYTGVPSGQSETTREISEQSPSTVWPNSNAVHADKVLWQQVVKLHVDRHPIANRCQPPTPCHSIGQFISVGMFLREVATTSRIFFTHDPPKNLSFSFQYRIQWCRNHSRHKHTYRGRDCSLEYEL